MDNWCKAVLLESRMDDKDLKIMQYVILIIRLSKNRFYDFKSLSWTHPSKIKGVSIYELKTGAVIQDRSQVVK